MASASSKGGAAPSCTASKSTATGRITRSQNRRPVLVQLARASRSRWPDTIVPDFPLTNKSFNLSYAGNDL